MQALKTIANSAYFAASAEPVDAIKAATAWVCGSDALYIARDASMGCLELTAPSTGGDLTVRVSDKKFMEAYALTHNLALLYGDTLLMARGCVKQQEPTLSAAIGFWNVRPGHRSGTVEKVRDVQVQTPHGGAITTWAWHEDNHSFTVALAFEDIHCSVQLLTFKRSELRPSKPTVSTLAIAKDSNGEASITNMHLIRSENDPTDLRLFVTLAYQGGAGRIESRTVDGKLLPGTAVPTLEASTVRKGRSAEIGSNQVIVVTSSDQSVPVASVLLLLFEPVVKDGCLWQSRTLIISSSIHQILPCIIETRSAYAEWPATQSKCPGCLITGCRWHRR
jgi:hypothetical protein